MSSWTCATKKAAAQVETWVPRCLLNEEVDVDTLTSEELLRILNVIRGDDEDGAVPLV